MLPLTTADPVQDIDLEVHLFSSLHHKDFPHSSRASRQGVVSHMLVSKECFCVLGASKNRCTWSIATWNIHGACSNSVSIALCRRTYITVSQIAWASLLLSPCCQTLLLMHSLWLGQGCRENQVLMTGAGSWGKSSAYDWGRTGWVKRNLSNFWSFVLMLSKM